MKPDISKELNNVFADARMLDYNFNTRDLSISFLYHDKKFIFYFINCKKIIPDDFLSELDRLIKKNLRDLLEIKELRLNNIKRIFHLLYSDGFSLEIECGDFYYEMY